MNTKKILFWAALPLLGACSNADEQEGLDANEGRVPVTLTAETVQAVQTRAGAAASQTLNEGNLTTGDVVKVGIRNYDSGNTGDYTDYSYTVTNATGAMSVTGGSATPYYPTDNDGSIDIIAYYPSTAATTFEVNNNQSTDANYRASDLMWAKVANQGRQIAAVALQFQHLMAKLNVNVSAGAGVSYIKSVTMRNVILSSTFAPKAGTATVQNVSASTITMFTGGDDADDDDEIGCACVFPGQSIAAGELLQITVVKEGGDEATATYSLAADKTFAGGSEYTMTITVNRTALGTTNSISGWSADGTTVIIQPAALQQTFDVDNNSILTFNVAGVQFQMIGVKGGSTLSNYASTGNSPATSTSLKITSDYYIGQTEVTNALWKAVMGSTPSASGWTDDQQPVQYVSWLDICGGTYSETTVADEDCFLTKLNAALAEQLPAGKTFKLPTEGQWEYAARGGSRSKSYTYAGSSTINDVAWYTSTSSSKTHPVGLLIPNELGLYDMSGNVWEWCSDWYGTLTNNTTLTDPTGAAEGSDRVHRGGGWGSTAASCAVSHRRSDAPTRRNYRIGLRLVLQ